VTGGVEPGARLRKAPGVALALQFLDFAGDLGFRVALR
jgi:hypothetical protein